MASAVNDAGSPLDEYFRDAGDDDGQDTFGGGNDSDSGEMSDLEEDDPGNITLVNMPREVSTRSSPVSKVNDGWTHTIHSIAGPSSPPGDYPSYKIHRLHWADETFAERFKYAICSSGVLEKEHVPGLGGLDRGDVNDTLSDTSDAAESRDKPATSNVQYTMSAMGHRAEEIGELGLRRWDIVLAVLVLFCALGSLMGVRLLVIGSLSIAGIAGATCAILNPPTWKLRLRPPITMSEPPPGTLPTQDESSLFPTPQETTLSSLNTLLTSSRNLNSLVESALSLLAPHPPNSTALQALRLAIHRFTGNMTDHLASTTSMLLVKADKGELEVLGEMYDIPIHGNSYHARKLDGGRDSGEEDKSVESGALFGSIPGPRQPFQTVPITQPNPSKHRLVPLVLQSLAMSPSRSLPGHFRPTHRVHHLSLPHNTSRHAVSPLGSPLTVVGDRFTSLPPRTPRTSKRASLDQQMWSLAHNSGPVSTSPMNNHLHRPVHERRITESDDEDDGDQSSSEDSRRTSGSNVQITAASSLPTSPNILGGRTFTSKCASTLLHDQTSPLLDRSSRSTQTTLTLLSSPFATPNLSHSASSIPNSKRSSLHNLPYYTSSDDDPATPVSTLSKSHGQPRSDIQALRSRYATGSRSRRTSLIHTASSPSVADPTLSPTLVTSTPQSRFERVVSISPLTLPALKASCLGLHLRRRRLACCLLGLKFETRDDEYWGEVQTVLGELCVAVNEERAKLDRAVCRAKEQTEVTLQEDVESTGPPWMSKSSIDVLGDFAPRTSDESLLLERIETIQSAITRAWEHLAAVKMDVSRSRTNGIGMKHRWGKVREEMGTMIRDWDRGKDLVSQLDRISLPTEDTALETSLATLRESREMPSTKNNLPEFIQAWSEDTDNSPSTSLETIPNPASLDGQDEPELGEMLPPPGVDIVFESDVLAVQYAKSSLTRDERIRLAKEARERSTTLGQIPKLGGSQREELESDEQGEEARKRTGDMVDELKGMIGLIRRRKGVVEDGTNGKVADDQRDDGQGQEDGKGDLGDGTDDGARGSTSDRDWRQGFAFPALDRRPEG